MITEEQREKRMARIGASDWPSILGVGYQSPDQVYWSKVGPHVPDVNRAHFDVGNRLESVLCDYAAHRLGDVEIERDVHVWPEGMIFGANLDAKVVGVPEGIEAKYSGDGVDWGDEGTDQIPERVILQCQGQAHVADLERVWVPAFIAAGRAEFRLYCVPRDQELIDLCVARLSEWWETHVVAGVPPTAGSCPPIDVLKRMRREPETCVTLDNGALDAWAELEGAKSAAKEADRAKDEAQARVLMLLGESEAGRMPDGRLMTYMSQASAPSVDHARLRALAPEAYEACVTRGTHRVLRIKKAKS